jgi:cytidylate kinase
MMNGNGIIITVGRQLGSGGLVIAKKLSETFGCNFFDKELLNLAARESGFSEKLFEKNDENKNFLLSTFHFHAPYVSDVNFYKNSLSPESLFKFQSDVILRAADEGNCVFVGRCADYILRDYERRIDLFITASMEDRLQRICERRQVDRATARKYMQNGDNNRSSYYNYYTGKVWGASQSYDLCINSSTLGIEKTGQFLEEYIRERFQL